MWVFNLFILVLFPKVVKLLLSRLPLTIVFLVLFSIFKDVVDCVLFLPKEVRPM